MLMCKLKVKLCYILILNILKEIQYIKEYFFLSPGENDCLKKRIK